MLKTLTLIFLGVFLLVILIVLFFPKSAKKINARASEANPTLSVISSILLVTVTALLVIATDMLVGIEKETKDTSERIAKSGKLFEMNLHQDQKEFEEQMHHEKQRFEMVKILLDVNWDVYKEEKYKSFRKEVRDYISDNFQGKEGNFLKTMLASKIPAEKAEILAMKYSGWIYVGNYNYEGKFWVEQSDRLPSPHISNLRFDNKLAPEGLLEEDVAVLAGKLNVRIDHPIVDESEPTRAYFRPLKGTLKAGDRVTIKELFRVPHPATLDVNRIYARIEY